MNKNTHKTKLFNNENKYDKFMNHNNFFYIFLQNF
jgi:hypothetical protein